MNNLQSVIQGCGKMPLNMIITIALILILIAASVITKKQNTEQSYNTDGYIPVLDGLRAVCMLLIFFFHDWQQTWLMANIHIGSKIISLEPLQRYGYIAIDAFFVLSGFCLFYPIARNMFGETKKEFNIKEFYIKRLRRILPAYYLMLIVLLIFPTFSYVMYDTKKISDIIKHFGSHALFLHIYRADTLGSTISTAWTMGIEVAFYVFFPLINKIFKKNPTTVFALMFIVSQVLRLVLATHTKVGMYEMTNPLLYIDIFGWGMLSAYMVVYVRSKRINLNKPLMNAISVLSLVGVYFYILWLGKAHIDGEDAQNYHRLLYRFILDGMFAMFIFSAVYSCKGWYKFWGNKVFAFLSGISYSFYLWHQNIHIALRKLNIPHTNANPPMSDKKAMIGFMFLSLAISLCIAIFSTYCIEKPIVKDGLKFYKNFFKKSIDKH